MSFKKGFFYVFISNLIGVFISIVTGFVLPKFLSIESYSDIKLFQLYVTYLGILHLGYSDGMYLKYGGKDLLDIDKKEVLEEFRTFKSFQFIIFILGIIISLFLKNKILLFCMISLMPINVGNYLRNLYQATAKFDKYAKFTSINNILIFIMNMILLFIIKSDNSNYYIISYVLSYFLYWFLLEKEVSGLFGKTKTKLFDFKYLVENIKEGFLLMIGNFSSVLFTSIDKLLVNSFLGVVKFAYYSFAVSIENLMNTVIGPISIVMYNYLCKNKDKEKVIFIKNLLLIFVSFTIILVFPVSFIVNYWIEKYIPSLSVLYLLFIAQYFSIIVRCIFNNLYKAERKQNRYFGVMIAVIVISIVLNLIGYSIFKNMEIFAIATVITSLIWFLIGEFDFKEYRYSLKQYIFIFLIIILYLIANILFNPIVGCILYLVVLIILIFLFLPKEFIYIKDEGISLLNKIMKR